MNSFIYHRSINESDKSREKKIKYFFKLKMKFFKFLPERIFEYIQPIIFVSNAHIHTLEWIVLLSE